MTFLKWEFLNDSLFVSLVADLLRESNFTAITMQGDGPDGGLDLFATEHYSLGLQDQKTFRWGIQCKFSIDGKKRAVNDEDIRDVEGILRSDRYTAQSLQGYMLVTNKRLAQNVIERLRGIDAKSQFRTTSIDGEQLELKLLDHEKIINTYFVRLPKLAENTYAVPINTYLLYKTICETYNQIQHQLPDRSIQELSLRIRSAFENPFININTWSEELPVNEKIRRTFYLALQERLPKAEYEIDRKLAETMIRKIHFEGDYGFRISVPSLYYKNLIQSFERITTPDGQQAYQIVIITKNWRKLM